MGLNKKRSLSSLLMPLLFGLIIGVISLYFFYNKFNLETNFEELALGDENTTSIEFVNNIQVHCYDLDDIEKCLDGYKNSRPEEDVILWLGNSQLHTINQMKPNDFTAPHTLHTYVINDSKYVLTFSQPNANLQEHYLLFEYLVEMLPIKTLILPVVFDDMRETGIRPSLLDILKNKNVIKNLNDTKAGKNVYLSNINKDSSGNDISALNGTIQEKVEDLLDSKLKNIWGIWGDRPQMRGQLFANMYFFRNWLLGINPSSVRNMIPGRYALNLDALKAIINSAKKQKIDLIVYIVPLRNDSKIPYNINEYSNFLKEVEHLSKASGVNFLDLENLVPSIYWGVKSSTSLSKKQELDFMHFQANGHNLLADKIYKELENIWNNGNKNDF
jgi:hypothetical protein